MEYSSIRRILFMFFCIVFLDLKSQENFTNINKENTKNILLDEIILNSDSLYSYSKSQYILLKHRVLKVSPYADSIVMLVKNIDMKIFSLKKKRNSRRYIRKKQKELIDYFFEDISSLTRKEGVILCKIIYRNMGISAYDLIRKYRGKFRAFFWQSLSKVYEGDLKTDFDPNHTIEDELIDFIFEIIF